MDAFQEVYHLKHIHPDTVDAAIDHRSASMALFPQGSSRMLDHSVDKPIRSPPADLTDQQTTLF